MIRAIGERPHEMFVLRSGKALAMLLGRVQECFDFIIVFDRHHFSLLRNVMEMRAYLGGLAGLCFASRVGGPYIGFRSEKFRI
ncbi:hypothetical protein DW682_06030 [Collinsella intestinalis]|uniref:Uncharacterized protein n=1 Tax=Collinsella intestinalis TaxID=147207 RepID=A0A414NDQ8_9ACTN|nr:hypothetical protein DW682_06030 [Collinsella intestinalis]